MIKIDQIIMLYDEIYNKVQPRLGLSLKPELTFDSGRDDRRHKRSSHGWCSVDNQKIYINPLHKIGLIKDTIHHELVHASGINNHGSKFQRVLHELKYPPREKHIPTKQELRQKRINLIEQRKKQALSRIKRNQTLIKKYNRQLAGLKRSI